MFEIVKTLAEEPAKLRKLIFFILKFILSAIVSSKLYTWIFGEFELINLTIPEFWNELYNFILSGNVVIVFFIYLVSRFLLFDVFASIPNLILNSISKGLFSNKTDLSDNDLIRILLKSLDVITFDKQTKKIGIGESFDNFYEVLNLYQHKENKDEVYSFKNSLMNETLHIYFVFFLIYSCFLNIEKSGLFTTILIIGLVINVLIYFIIYFLIQFFNNNGKDILFGLNLLCTEKVLIEFLKDHKVLFSENEKQKGNKLSKFIVLNGEEALIDIYTGKIPITKYALERYIQQAINNNVKKLILISDKRLTTEAKELMKKNELDFDFIYFKNHLSLNNKLYNLIFD